MKKASMKKDAYHVPKKNVGNGGTATRKVAVVVPGGV
jgi:hypothetical protein